jgi:hypothetical protein
MRIIEFSPPMSGLEGEFNTFRLGVAWSKRLAPGDTVCLMNKKEFSLMGYAEVKAVHVGKLSDMSALHARRNHNQLGLPSDGAGERLIANMIRRYGPHKVNHTVKVTVIYMNRRQL